MPVFRLIILLRFGKNVFKESVVFASILTLIALTTGLFAAIPARAAADWSAHNPISIRAPRLRAMLSAPVVSGLYPVQIRKAYGIDSLNTSGAGKTIAIIDAFGSPTITSDLAVFNNQFSLARLILPSHTRMVPLRQILPGQLKPLWMWNGLTQSLLRLIFCWWLLWIPAAAHY